MQLSPYVEQVHRQLALAAQATNEEAQALAERLVAAAEPAVRMALLDAITDAAAEITVELAPGSVEVRLRDRDPRFVVTLPPSEPADAADDQGSEPATFDADDDEQARINVRMPAQLKQRVEQAAAREGMSINTWLVRAAATAVERGGAPPRRRPGPQIGERYTGWVR